MILYKWENFSNTNKEVKETLKTRKQTFRVQREETREDREIFFTNIQLKKVLENFDLLRTYYILKCACCLYI